MFCIALVGLFCFPLQLPTFWATINSSMCCDHSKIQLCLHPDPSFSVSGVDMMLILFEMTSLICSDFFSSRHGGSLANGINKGCSLVQLFFYWCGNQYNIYCSSKWKCQCIEIKLVVYTQSVTHRWESQEGACASAFFFCFLFSCFFFVSPLFCFWRFSWIFSLNFFFWLLIFSSSAFLLASKSGSWYCRLTPHWSETPKSSLYVTPSVSTGCAEFVGSKDVSKREPSKPFPPRSAAFFCWSPSSRQSPSTRASTRWKPF